MTSWTFRIIDEHLMVEIRFAFWILNVKIQLKKHVLSFFQSWVRKCLEKHFSIIYNQLLWNTAVPLVTSRVNTMSQKSQMRMENVHIGLVSQIASRGTQMYKTPHLTGCLCYISHPVNVVFSSGNKHYIAMTINTLNNMYNWWLAK